MKIKGFLELNIYYMKPSTYYERLELITFFVHKLFI